VEGAPVLDLCYLEDAQAATDMNVVLTGSGQFVEIQGTAEQKPFAEETFLAMLALARRGCGILVSAQRDALGANS